jgi:hypothetical protein
MNKSLDEAKVNIVAMFLTRTTKL